jgi:hypothetical protein
MAESWLKLSSHYRTARERQGMLWNRTNSLDILNFFIDQHGRLIESFGYDYLQLERSMVTQAAKQYEARLPFDPLPEHEIQIANSDTQRNLACWRVALATYCRIHGRLKVELRAWNQSDYDEFESTIHRLCEEVC